MTFIRRSSRRSTGSPWLGHPRASAAQRRRPGGGVLGGVQLAVGQARVVVDADVHELPADVALVPRRRARDRVLAGPPVTRCPATPWMRPSFLTSMCSSSPGPRALVAFGGSGGSSRASLPNPIRISTAETVDSAIAKQLGDLGAVIRSLRSAAITSTRSSGVRCGDRPGAEERSNSPGLTLGQVALHPLRARALAHSGRRRRLRSATNPPRAPADHHPRPFTSGALA